MSHLGHWKEKGTLTRFALFFGSEMQALAKSDVKLEAKDVVSSYKVRRLRDAAHRGDNRASLTQCPVLARVCRFWCRWS